MHCYLSNFHHIRPKHEVDQAVVLDWVARAHAQAAAQTENVDYQTFYDAIKQRLLQLGVGPEKIARRGIHLDDFFQPWEECEIYPVNQCPTGNGFKARSIFYDREASAILERFYPEDAQLPPHLIHVTCTGYVAPSPAQRLISNRKAGQRSIVTHAYHMGCNGAFPAIRMAMGYAGLPSPLPTSLVDIVHTELCSLHMHPLRHSTEQLIVQSLFADGFIKYSLSKVEGASCLKVLAVHEELIPDSLESMSWRCEDAGLSMTLGKEVPILIGRALKGFLERLCTMAGIEYQAIVKQALFAVHPGGPKILQHVRELLDLSEAQMSYSQKILRAYGNMSSATLPHIWEEMLNDPQVEENTPILSLAFGPGLSICGALFQKVD